MSDQRITRQPLTTSQIEERLRDTTIPGAERDSLVQQLQDRLVEEYVQPSTPSTPPTPPAARPKQAGKPRQAHGPSPTPPPVPPKTPPAPPPMPPEHVASGPPAPRRRGFSRSTASLLAVLVTGAVAWGVIAAAQSNDSDGSFPPPSQTQVTGPVGSTTVTWVRDDVRYDADVTTDGATGTAEVTYVDPIYGDEIVVVQDLYLEDAGDHYEYVGDNPTDPITGESAAGYYLPDVFRLEEDSDGWYFSEVCDSDGCADAA